MSAWYLDSSAIVKFAVAEHESPALLTWRSALGPDDVLITSELAIAEVVRAVRRVGGDVPSAVTHLDSLDQLAGDRDLLVAVGRLEPDGIRTLDAIHLASAITLGEELSGVVTYDDRMAAAARDLGLQTLAPRSAK